MYSKKATPAAWIKPKSSQGLTSDLLTPRPRPNLPQRKGKGKDTSPSPTPPQSKSKEVKRLERLIDSLESGLPHSGAGREGCFCNARVHSLSSYTPLCPHCGLILCILQAPSLPCPSCHSPLLSPAARATISHKLSMELQTVLQKEEAVREAARIEAIEREIAARGGGSFPTLGPSAGSSHGTISRNIHNSPPLPPPEAPRKVLSISAKGKGGRVIVSSFSPAPPPPLKSQPSAVEDDIDDEFSGMTPVPPPPEEPDYHRIRHGTERRWEDLRGGGIMYVQPPAAVNRHRDGGEASGKRRRKGKGKASESIASGSVVSQL